MSFGRGHNGFGRHNKKGTMKVRNVDVDTLQIAVNNSKSSAVIIHHDYKPKEEKITLNKKQRRKFGI